MSIRRVVILAVCLAALFIAGAAVAQTAAATPQAAQTTSSATTAPAPAAIEGGEPRYIRAETPEQRQARLGTNEDPGPNPDPEKVFIRFGRPYHIHRYEKKYAKYTREGWVRPVANFNAAKEIYQENEKYVWVWAPDNTVKQEAKRATLADSKYREYSNEGVAYLEKVRGEFTPVDVPQADVTVRFEDGSKGLPTSGSWRNYGAVADINEDGFPDLVLPPQRGLGSVPAIYYGDGKGGWKAADMSAWPSFNYGGVVAADFNKDKHVDLAFAVHLIGVAVFLGDGKGAFRRVESGLPTDYPTRRVVATDINADGWTDLVAISEGPVGRGEEFRTKTSANLIGLLNRKKGEEWEGTNLSGAKEFLAGDWLETGNFNGDKYPDFAGSSIYFSGTQILYVSDAKNGGKYSSVDRGDGQYLPLLSYYYGMTTGPFSTPKLDDVVMSYYRMWPSDLNAKVVATPPLKTVVGLDRVSFAGGKPVRTPILRWGSDSAVAISGITRGDFDGDGKLDVLFTRVNPREAVLLLGDGAGKFKRASIEGLTLAPQRNYSVQVADVNGDKRPDVILMYESEETTALSKKNGRVQVFLNRGAAPAQNAAK
ncbi:MAG TPA: VCBS repeat-containing protein [Thermoanaerobaculia bacterium]|jgi:hypothetical protein